ANADKNYGQASSSGERKPNPWILTKILRYHNNDYYEQTIKLLLKKNYEIKKKEKQIIINQTLIPNKIDLQDGFTLLDMQEKAANGEYENEEQIVMDLTRLLVYYEGETEDIHGLKDMMLFVIYNFQIYFDLIKETIAAIDERVYEYILNLIPWVIQNPGKKSRAAIVLQGRQGISKIDSLM
ncbi:MAG: hypothetical protein EZS28_050803, partial [Streblomastix strix]